MDPEQLFDLPGLEAKLAELVAERDRLLAEVPIAREAEQQALRNHDAAQARHNAVILRVNLAAGSDNGNPGTISAALNGILQTERELYQAAGAALAQAKDRLKNLQYDLSSRNADIVQLQRLIDPPVQTRASQRPIGFPPIRQMPEVDFDNIFFDKR